MPSKDSKTPEKNDKNVVKFNANAEKPVVSPKKKSKITVSQIVTYIILGLLAIVLVVGVALPALGPKGASSEVVFGSYDGTPIEFAFGNYFYNQYQTLAQQNKEAGDIASYQIWRGAFESTVFHTAMTQKAKAAGVRVADKTLNQVIIDSGIYHKDGRFDVATYENASLESKNKIKSQYRENMPVQMVLEDIATVLSSPDEMDYVIRMGDSARSFEYVVFDSSLYPDELTRQYATANPSLFTLLDVSLISLQDQERAEDVRESIVSGLSTFEEAAKEYSLDSFANEGGRSGMWYLHELQENFANPEEVNLLFSTPAGQVSQVFASQGGYVLYRVEQDPIMADVDDPDVLEDVKTYIGTRDEEVVTTYLSQQATEFAETTNAGEDFVERAKTMGITVNTVEATPPNVGGSKYLIDFSYTDEGGYLGVLSNDVDAMTSLYTLPVGSSTEPLPTNNVFVVAKVTEESALPDDMGDYLRLMYPYMSQSQSQQDLVQAIFNSDKLDDKFLPTYFDKIMNIGAAK